VELQEQLLLRVLLHGMILLMVQGLRLLIWMVLALLGEKEEMEAQDAPHIEKRIKEMVVTLFMVVTNRLIMAVLVS
jgi:hypothetical protein